MGIEGEGRGERGWDGIRGEELGGERRGEREERGEKGRKGGKGIHVMNSGKMISFSVHAEVFLCLLECSDLTCYSKYFLFNSVTILSQHFRIL